MSTWSPENSIVTNLGNSLLASARVGLGTIKVTRVVARENFESSMSTAREYTLSDITEQSIAQEGFILDTRVTDHPDPEEEVETSLITVRFSNDELESDSTTYNLRQIVILACLVDPLTQEEGEEVPYMVSQCDDSTDCDVMPARASNPTSFDYDIYMIHSGVDSVTIEVRTSGYVWHGEFDAYKEEVEDSLEELENDMNSKMSGISTKDETFTSWVPTYSESHAEWEKDDSDSVTGLTGAERFNSQNISTTNIAVGVNSSAFGKDTESLNECSFTTGTDNYNNSANSFISGRKNTARNGGSNFIVGEYNEIKGENAYFNALFGFANEVDGVSATFTFGEHLVNKKSATVLLGKYNDYTSQEEYVIAVGGGTSENDRVNIFSLSKTGNLKIPAITVGTIYNPDGTEKTFDLPTDFIKRGEASYTFITNNTTQNKASGMYASTFGNNNEASGSQSFATGRNNKAIGVNSVVFGSDNTNRGENSVVGGKYISNQSAESVVFGNGCTVVNAKQSTVFGSSDISIRLNTEQDAFNTVLGSSYAEIQESIVNTVLGNQSDLSINQGGGNLVVGSKIMSSTEMQNAEHCTVLNIGGVNNTLSNSSQVSCFGSSYIEVDYAEQCMLFGKNLKIEGTSSSKITNQFVIGKYNKNVTDKAFVIGNGTSSERHNAIEIDFNGNIFCNGAVKSLNERISDLEQAIQQMNQ